MIDPAAQADFDAMKVALAAAEAAGARLFARVPELPDPPPEPIFDVPAHISLIEEAGQTFVSVDIANDVDAPRDYEFFVETIYGTATAEDIDIGPGPHILKQGSRLLLIPVTPKDDSIPDSGETLRIRITCAQAVTFLNDTCLVTITDSDVQEPQPGVTFHKRAINLTRELCLTTWFKGWERYDRGIQRHVIEPGKPVKCRLACDNRAAGGVAQKLPGPEYGITLNGTEVLRVRPAADGWADVAFVAEDLPASFEDGAYQVDLNEYDGNGNPVLMPLGGFVPSFVYLNRNGKLKDAPWFPSYSSSYQVARNGGVFQWAKIPRSYIFDAQGNWIEPEEAPLLSEPHPEAWTAMLPSSEFTAIQLNPYLKDDHHIMTRDRFGAPAFEGSHVYLIAGANFENKDYWMFPSVDGPRGKGRVIHPTDAQPSRMGGAHFLDHMSFGHCHADGYVQRQFGWVIDWPYPQYQEEALIKSERRLIGNWDAVPEAKRGLDRSWTWVWDPRTVKRGTGAPIVNDGRNMNGVLEPPHDGEGPTVLLPRPRHKDLLEAVYDPKSHLIPPKLRIGIDGLSEPWGVTITEDGIVMVTEQGGANRVSAYQRNLDGTYTKLWEVGGIPRPQGIDHDGQGNVYVGSLGMRAVYRFNMETRNPELFKPLLWTAKSFFVSVHVNRDPETGGVYICASSGNEAANFGNPETWLPDGTKVNPFPASYAPHGWKGGDTATYAAPARTGWRVMVRGGSDIGLLKWRRKRPGDIDFAAAGYWDATGFHRQFTDDSAKWHAEGFHLVYGPRATPSICIDVNEVRGFAPWAGRFIDVCRWGE
jgi:hypothetical protein